MADKLLELMDECEGYPHYIGMGVVLS
jgi:hypothetical protein